MAICSSVITLVENIVEADSDDSTFSLDHLSTLAEQASGRSIDLIIDITDEYASKHLEQIGEGTARNVYAISHDAVLKVAKDRNSVRQNAAEAKISKNAPSAPIARVMQRSRPKSVWIASQRAAPLSGADAFEMASGQTWDSFEASIRAAVSGRKSAEPRSKLAQATWNLIYDHGLDLPDVIDLKHWGLLPDGSLVLFDYGEIE